MHTVRPKAQGMLSAFHLWGNAVQKKNACCKGVARVSEWMLREKVNCYAYLVCVAFREVCSVTPLRVSLPVVRGS